MPSKLSVHLSGYPNNAFDILEKTQPSVVKVFNQNSEMNVDEIRRRCSAIIFYRQFTNLDYHSQADAFYFELKDTLGKLRGRGIVWEGLNEPVPNSIADAKALNAWYVRFAQIMHAEGERVAGFSWSTGNPTPAQWNSVIPYVVEAAAAVDVHAFHEYCSGANGQKDWGQYRKFEQAMPSNARKPVVITEAGYDDTGQPNGGYLGKISVPAYINILKQYDQVLLQDSYVLGATVFQWGDGSWPSFDLSPAVAPLSDYIVSVGQGARIPYPWPVPVFGPTPTFTASPSTIFAGQQTTLSWNVPNAKTVTLNGQAVGGSGSMVVTPAATTIYALHIVFQDNSTQDQSLTVTVQATATPIILQSGLSPTSLLAGQQLNVSIIVKNNGNDTLATQGPDPGFAYNEGDTFYTRGFPEQNGAYRVGIDFDGHTGIDHPYRWGLGAPLAPGQSATISGSIKLSTPQAVNYWAGLVHEQMAWVQDRQGTQTITVKPLLGSLAQITQVTLAPAMLSAGQLLNVSITVVNNSSDTLTTQGPDPGLVYNEGDTFYTRGFPDQNGAYRVGIDFDGRAGAVIDYPYRWGLGAPLAPGQSVTVTGAIRLKTPRAVRYWAGVVREQILWVQDNQGAQVITVNAAPNAAQIVDASFTPTTLASGQALTVSITVFNNTNQSITTQGPDPGFAYVEGDTFYTRNFADINGAYRVGVDFDGWAGIDHPFRWGLGAPLAAGQIVTVSGTIQLKTAQAINYWAGLVREQTVWLQDHTGAQKITVTS